MVENKHVVRICYYLILFFSVLGLAMMVYLPLELNNVVPNSCNINSAFSCSTVAKSPYSNYFGFGVYVYGWIFFSLIIALTLVNYFIRQGKSKRLFRYLLFVFSVLGAVGAAYLIFTEVAYIGAICPVCLTAQICIFSILGISSYLFIRRC